MTALEEIKKNDKEEVKEEVVETVKKEGFVFKSKIPNLYIYSLKIRFIKGEYVTKDKKEAEDLRKIKGVEEVTQK